MCSTTAMRASLGRPFNLGKATADTLLTTLTVTKVSSKLMPRARALRLKWFDEMPWVFMA
jgi:hypothetical protein